MGLVKPSLPTLNLAKVKAVQSDGDPGSPGGTFSAASHALASTNHFTKSSTRQSTSQASKLDSPRQAHGSTTGRQQGHAPGHGHASVTKANVPGLNFGGVGLGFGTSGGIETSLTARGPPPPSHAHSAANTHAHGSATHRVTNSTHHGQQQTASQAAQQQAVLRAQQQALARRSNTSAAEPDSEDESSSAWESGAISAGQAIKRYSEFLTSYELGEILDYQNVFFVGRSGVPKIQGNQSAPINAGYDDDHGDYKVVLHDHLLYRFEAMSVLGRGSFGQVLKCHDFKNNIQCAVKIIRNKKRFQHQAMVELKVLEYLVRSDPEDNHNVIHILEHFTFRNHLCIVFELLSVNLYELIKQNNYQGLSIGLIRRFAQQMLTSLKFMKSLNIIHCDLKPENILLRVPNRSTIKIIDFGSSCLTDERIYTYIQSRFYRSPEVILGLTYGPEIDMWSVGCILAELYTGYPLFPGEDESEQLQYIMETLGIPPTPLLETASRRKLFFDTSLAPRITPNSQGKTHHPGSKQLASTLKCSDVAFLDFLERCFTWDPSDRITPEEALQHHWVMDPNAPQPTARQQQQPQQASQAKAQGVAASGTMTASTASSRVSVSHLVIPASDAGSASAAVTATASTLASTYANSPRKSIESRAAAAQSPRCSRDFSMAIASANSPHKSMDSSITGAAANSPRRSQDHGTSNISNSNSGCHGTVAAMAHSGCYGTAALSPLRGGTSNGASSSAVAQNPACAADSSADMPSHTTVAHGTDSTRGPASVDADAHASARTLPGACTSAQDPSSPGSTSAPKNPNSPLKPTVKQGSLPGSGSSIAACVAGSLQHSEQPTTASTAATSAAAAVDGGVHMAQYHLLQQMQQKAMQQQASAAQQRQLQGPNTDDACEELHVIERRSAVRRASGTRSRSGRHKADTGAERAAVSGILSSRTGSKASNSSSQASARRTNPSQAGSHTPLTSTTNVSRPNTSQQRNPSARPHSIMPSSVSRASNAYGPLSSAIAVSRPPMTPRANMDSLGGPQAHALQAASSSSASISPLGCIGKAPSDLRSRVASSRKVNQLQQHGGGIQAGGKQMASVRSPPQEGGGGQGGAALAPHRRYQTDDLTTASKGSSVPFSPRASMAVSQPHIRSSNMHLPTLSSGLSGSRTYR